MQEHLPTRYIFSTSFYNVNDLHDIIIRYVSQINKTYFNVFQILIRRGIMHRNIGVQREQLEKLRRSFVISKRGIIHYIVYEQLTLALNYRADYH